MRNEINGNNAHTQIYLCYNLYKEKKFYRFEYQSAIIE